MKMLHKTLGYGAVAAALAFNASTTQAQTIVNPGFENAGGFTANPITVAGVDQGWAAFDPSVTQSDMSGSLTLSPQSGTYALYTTIAAGNNWQTEGAYQVISGITPGHTYQFSVYAATDTGVLYQGALIQLGFETAALGGANSVENPGGTVGIAVKPTINTWTQYTVNATAPAGCTDAIMYLMLQDYGQNVPVNGQNTPIPTAEDMYFDSSSIKDITAVPEPTTLALAGLGGMSLLSLIRRRNS